MRKAPFVYLVNTSIVALFLNLVTILGGGSFFKCTFLYRPLGSPCIPPVYIGLVFLAPIFLF